MAESVQPSHEEEDGLAGQVHPTSSRHLKTAGHWPSPVTGKIQVPFQFQVIHYKSLKTRCNITGKQLATKTHHRSSWQIGEPS